MECKCCGNNITDGTYCSVCGNDNSDHINYKKLDNAEDNVKKKKYHKNLKILIFLIIFLVILWIITSINENSFNSCVERVGHSECGLGALCDHECMPPYYFLFNFLFVTLLAITLIYVPAILIFNLIHSKLKNFYLFKKKN